MLWSECLAATHGNLLTLWKSISDSPESRRKNVIYVYWVRSQSCNEITDECSKTAFLLSVLWTYSLWKLLTKTYPTKNIVFLLWNRFCTRPGFWRRILDSEDPQATTYPKQQTLPVKAPSLESLVNDHFFKAAATSFVVDGFIIFHCFNYRMQGMFLILCYSDWEHRAFSHLWRHVRLVRHTIKWHPTSPVGKRVLLPHYHMIIIWWS